MAEKIRLASEEYKMTVREVITLLEKFDPEARVLVTGSGLCKPPHVGPFNGRTDTVLIGTAY